MTPRTVLRQGIERCVGTYQEVARHINVTPSMLSKMLSGERSVAPDVASKLSGMHLIAGLALAEEVTNYSCFSYIIGDRHPQTMVRRVEKEDAEADEALRALGLILIDKGGPEDLTPDERTTFLLVGKELADRIRADLNLLVELDDRFKLGLVDYLADKKKTPMAAEARAQYKFSQT